MAFLFIISLIFNFAVTYLTVNTFIYIWIVSHSCTVQFETDYT